MSEPTTSELFEVESSSLVSLEYFTYTKLRVVFTNGRIYEYEGVPRDVLDSVLSAPSVGKEFAKSIRMSYPFIQVVDA